MYFIQFYTRSVPNEWNGYKRNLIEACGDRAVCIIDGRESQTSQEILAVEECKKRNYSGYSIHRGESFTRNQTIVPVTLVA